MAEAGQVGVFTATITRYCSAEALGAMKACPFCAEPIQDAAVKCRYCGSMLVGTDPDAGLTSPGDELLPGDTVPSGPWRTPSRWQVWALVAGAAILTVGVLLVVRAWKGAVPSPPAVTAAPAPVREPYRFADIQWGTPINEVRAQLASRGFVFSEQDEEGDHVFSGSIEGHSALVIAMLSRGALAKVIVVFPAHGSVNEIFDGAVGRLTKRYGPPEPAAGSAAEGRRVVTWASHPDTLGDTRLWVTVTDTGDVATHYESGQWPAESQRRKASHRTRNPAGTPASTPLLSSPLA